MKTNAGICLFVCLILAACSKQPEAPLVSQKNTGRPETKTLEAATVVGYDGKAVRNSVDTTLNKNDDRLKDMGRQAEETR